MKVKKKSYSFDSTIDYGSKFCETLDKKDVVILEGDLGGGKTTFVKGILREFGYKRRVLSPSFTLMRKYQIKKYNIYHIDLYRLKFSDLASLGFEDLLYSEDSISLIEWGNKYKDSLDKYIKVEFIFEGESIRSLVFSTKGYSQSKMKSIKKVLTDGYFRN